MGSGRTRWIHMLTKWCHIMSHLFSSGRAKTALWLYTRAQLNVGQTSFMPPATNFGDRLYWIHFHMAGQYSWLMFVQDLRDDLKMTTCPSHHSVPLDFSSWPCHPSDYRLTIIVRMVWALKLDGAGLIHPQYMVKVELAHGNASIHKDEQNQSQNNIQQLITAYFDLFEFLEVLCFLGPNLRWRLAHLWEILIDPKQGLDGTFVLKQQKAPVVFQRLLDQFYAPFFWFGLRSTKNRLQMHLFDQQQICTGKGEKLRYLGKFHWRPV